MFRPLAFAILVLGVVASLNARTILVNSTERTITVDDAPFDFGGNLARIDALPDGTMQVLLMGDLILATDDTVRGVGNYPVVFLVGNDVRVPFGAKFDFSAISSVPGAAGGNPTPGGPGGKGGEGGDGGKGGPGGTGGNGGLGGAGGGAFKIVAQGRIIIDGQVRSAGGNGEGGSSGGEYGPALSGTPGSSGGLRLPGMSLGSVFNFLIGRNDKLASGSGGKGGRGGRGGFGSNGLPGARPLP